MKNTLLLNPSSDPDSPNHAFIENIVPFLHQLSKIYVIHLICPVSSEQEKQQILGRLLNSKLFSSKVIDERRVLFCEKDLLVMYFGQIRGGNSEPINWAETGEVKANVDRSQWSNVQVCGQAV
ncbi:uncharacterized protein OCT59_006888 [Rhizophagus irregularis]|uniref:uncharacterized protein n=1 Tax=Rhizophagus irregularis TaxID=588596 RepID=UPI0019F618CF|nr:hypothetical protein OCT59_006888 [Rhizophagus irregularis]GBC32502.2 hypothetical protein GLOIN_2v1487012 [Rhizophagus irregularis DAOM 181602=DAOM 197198]